MEETAMQILIDWYDTHLKIAEAILKSNPPKEEDELDPKIPLRFKKKQ